MHEERREIGRWLEEGDKNRNQWNRVTEKVAVFLCVFFSISIISHMCSVRLIEIFFMLDQCCSDGMRANFLK